MIQLALLPPKYIKLYTFLHGYAHGAEIGMLARIAKMCSGFDKDFKIL